jgi:hypothetical protein
VKLTFITEFDRKNLNFRPFGTKSDEKPAYISASYEPTFRERTGNFWLSKPAMMARSPIGVIVSNLGDPVHPPIVRAIEDRFAEIGYVTLVRNTDNHPARQASLIDRLIGQGVDGLIVATFFRNDPIISNCLEAGTPSSDESTAELR